MSDKNSKKTKILVIEDDTFLSEMYVTKFNQEGFEVLTAVDGESGLKVAQEELPNVILLDVLLPKINGLELLDILKKNPKAKEIPVVILTNLGKKEDVENGLKRGAASYLIKGHFSPLEVLAKVKEVI